MSSTCHQSQCLLRVDQELQNISSTEHKHLWWSPHLVAYQITSVQFSCSVVSDFQQSYGLQHTRRPCPSPSPRACSDSCQSSWRCHPTISSSVIPFSSCLQSFPASGSFPRSQFFTSGGQNIWSFSFSISPSSISPVQDLFPLGLIGLIALQSKGFSRVFSNTIVQKHQFFRAQLSLWSNSHIRT